MLLKEFFGSAIEAGKKLIDNQDQKENQNDELFWYILDHDRLHKDYGIPCIEKMKKESKKGKISKDKYIKELKPMIEKGCLEFYHKNNLKGKIGKQFPKELRDNLCERLCDHYMESIENEKT
jgi:hypothetical protein